MLGQTLFNIFINNKDSGIEPSASLKMTPKLSGAVDSLEEKDQKDLDRLGKKTHANLLKFNRVLYVSWDNSQYQYRLGAEWIENIAVEKDLGYWRNEIFNEMPMCPCSPESQACPGLHQK